MKAMVYHNYGSPDVLKLEEVRKPTPADDEVLIKVHAASANAGDWHLLRGEPFLVRLMAGLRKPKDTILGADVAGRVEAVGESVTRFRPGDAVFGDLSESGFGAFAEYVSAPENALVPKPAKLSFEEAAAVPSAATTALQALRDKGRIQPGQRVLVNGASGGVGSFAVQIAKSFGADVTGVCSTRNLEMVRSLGADHVIDYTQEDYTQNGRRYDLIVDAAAYRPFSDSQRALNPNGIYVLIGGSGAQFLQATLLGPWASMTGDKKVATLLKKPNSEDLAFLADLLETGDVAPVIDRAYAFREIPEALRYLENGHAKGKVVINRYDKEETNGHQL